MHSITYQLDVLQGNDVTAIQEQFINHWNQHYFDEVAVAKGLAKAPVHWRLILRDGENLVSHVALTEMMIELDGQRIKTGAVGGLFTPLDLQGRGHATALMDRAEEFIFDRLQLPLGILFCLPELVPFYARRGWSLVENPVTLEQAKGVATWGAAVMLLAADRAQHGQHSIHVPMGKPASDDIPTIIETPRVKVSNLYTARVPQEFKSIANIHHDLNLYQIFYALTQITGDAKYAVEADRVIDYFLKHCQEPKYGFFCWGEHLG